MRVIVTYEVPEKNERQIASLDAPYGVLDALPDWIEGFPKTVEVRGIPRLQCHS